MNSLTCLGARICGEPNRLYLAPDGERHGAYKVRPQVADTAPYICAIVMRSMTLLPSEAVGRTAKQEVRIIGL